MARNVRGISGLPETLSASQGLEHESEVENMSGRGEKFFVASQRQVAHRRHVL